MVFNRFYGHEAIRPQVFQLLYKQYTGLLLVVVNLDGFMHFRFFECLRMASVLTTVAVKAEYMVCGL